MKSLLFALLALPVVAAAQKTDITIIRSHPVVRSYNQRITPRMAVGIRPTYRTNSLSQLNGDAIGPFALHNRRIGSLHYYAPRYRMSVPSVAYRVMPSVRARTYVGPRPVYMQRSGRSVRRGVLN